MLLSGKKVIVTSGATQEPLDNVRFLTNISRGSFGAMIADEAMIQQAEVYYLYGKGAVRPHFEHSMRLIEVRTTADLLREMHRLLVEFDASVVIHAMAVSDYIVESMEDPNGRQLKGEKIDADKPLTVRLRPSPNIIPRIKEWKRDAYLVGFELEPVESESELVEVGKRSLAKNHMDLAVVRRLHRIKKDDHDAVFVNTHGDVQIHHGKSVIAKELIRTIYQEVNPGARIEGGPVSAGAES